MLGEPAPKVQMSMPEMEPEAVVSPWCRYQRPRLRLNWSGPSEGGIRYCHQHNSFFRCFSAFLHNSLVTINDYVLAKKIQPKHNGGLVTPDLSMVKVKGMLTPGQLS